MAKKKFGKVAIVGMGLMGSSLGHSLLAGKLASGVTGIGRNMSRLKMALKKKAATEVTDSLEKGVNGADIVVIALPVLMIPSVFMKIAGHLKKGAVVTDMGSVKGFICSGIAKLDRDKVFCGSHPMVGSEKTGVDNMIPGLYKGGVCVVTRSGGKQTRAEKTAAALWKALGMKVLVMTPEEHDKHVARISHFPHLAAFVQSVMAEETIKASPDVIGAGFLDTTRVAASGEEIWSEIFLANKPEMLQSIDRACAELENLRQLIYSNNGSSLKDYIKKARNLRERAGK